jgi:hypothetical protein
MSSGGTFPVRVAIHGDLAYVLNAEGGAVHGYRITPGGLELLPGSNRALGLDPTLSPQFTSTPGQVAFSPDGRIASAATGQAATCWVTSVRGLLFADNRRKRQRVDVRFRPGRIADSVRKPGQHRRRHSGLCRFAKRPVLGCPDRRRRKVGRRYSRRLAS